MKGLYNTFVKINELDSLDRKILSSIGVDSSIYSEYYILPGFTDVHVHLREPGFLFKETIKTGTAAAAAGGFTDVFSMPNLNPCPDTWNNLKVQLESIKRSAFVNVFPYGSISIGEKGNRLSEMEQLSKAVIGYTDDGIGVCSDKLMEEAMIKAKALDRIIVAHCEDERFPKDSSEAEWKQLERDLSLVRKIKCKYHVCHISTKESVELIREAKSEGLDVTCETAPHYLTISKSEIMDDGKYKMNPPIKDIEDKKSLIEALIDGTIDMIATDHAPHTDEEKSRGFKDSAYGIVGLETAFPVLYTKLVLSDIISLNKLIDLLYTNPRKRFNLPICSIYEEIKKSKPTFTVWNLEEKYEINPDKFLSMGKSTPFEGWNVNGRCVVTVVNGNVIQEYKNERHNIKNIDK